MLLVVDISVASAHRDLVTSGIWLLLLLGPVVSDERPVDAPIAWPTGAQPTALSISNGQLIGVVDRSRAVLRFYSGDGGLDPALDLPDGVAQDSPLLLTRSATGVIVSYIRNFTSTGFAMTYDPATRVFGPAQPLGNSYTSRTYVAGQPGHLVALHREYVDGGLRTFSQQLNDDATTAGIDHDLTSYGDLSEVASNSTAHWVVFTSPLSDGGTQTALVRVGIDGAPASASFLDGYFPQVVATDNYVALMRTGVAFEFAFFTMLGALTARVSTPVLCAGSSSVALGDSVLTACGELGPGFQTTGVRMVKLEADGGFMSSLVLPGDGGTVQPGALGSGGAPLLLYTRRFTEVGRGNHVGSMLLPLDGSGLVSTGSPLAVFTRPSSQLSPAFSSREVSTPLALAWNDDRQLLREYLLEAVRLGPDGGALEAPTALQTLNSSFTNSNYLQRFIADDGQAFVLPAYQAFSIDLLEWPHVAGAPTKRANITDGIMSPPLICSLTTPGYVMAYSGLSSGSFAQYLDTQGNLSGARVSVSAMYNTVFDVISNGAGAFLLSNDLAAERVLAVEGNAVTELSSFPSASYGRFGRLGKSPAMLLVAWEEAPVVGTRIIRAARLRFDGGVLDQPALTITMKEVPGATSLQDIGYRAGVFHVLGVTATDAGSNLWVWSIGEDGGISASTVIEAPTDVLSVAAGPPISNSKMLFAYTRAVSGWGPSVQRAMLAALGDDLSLGATCARNSECGSRVCEKQVCCVQVGACTPADSGTPDGGFSDAGVADAGGGLSDAGAASDAGGVGDSGAGETDAGQAVADGGVTTPNPDAGHIGSTPSDYAVGCSCESSSGLVAVIALVGLCRRRRTLAKASDQNGAIA